MLLRIWVEINMSSRQNIQPPNKSYNCFFGLLVRQIVVFNLKKIDLWQHLLGLPCKAPSTTVFKRQLHTRLQKGWRRMVSWDRNSRLLNHFWADHHNYACLFLDEKRGMRNLAMRNFSRGKQTRKTRKCETKSQAFWKLLEEEMIENSKYFFFPIQPSRP